MGGNTPRDPTVTFGPIPRTTCVDEERPKSLKLPGAPKPTFGKNSLSSLDYFWTDEHNLQNQKEADHNSTSFDVPGSSPSFIWTPLVVPPLEWPRVAGRGGLRRFLFQKRPSNILTVCFF